MRTFLLVGGGVESTRGVEVARRLGFRVAVLDADPQAPAMVAADEKLVVSTYDVSAAVKAASALAGREAVVGVSSVATDVPLTVASIAERLGLPGIPVDAARRSSDKLLMKRDLLERGIPTAPYWPVTTLAELGAGLRNSAADEFILKPADSRGARGVLRLRPHDQLESLLAESLAHSPTGRCILEEFQNGPQFSSEGYFTPDWSATPGFSDRNYLRASETAPYMIEDGGESPSFVGADVRAQASELAVAAARALGAPSGIVKGDLVLTDDGPKVIEVALRLSGGWFSTHQIPLLTGVDLVEVAIRSAVGEEIPQSALQGEPHGGVAIRYYFPPEGRVLDVPDPRQIAEQPGVRHCSLNVTVGAVIGPITNHTKRAGHVITVGSSRTEAVRLAQAVIEGFPIVVDQVV